MDLTIVEHKVFFHEVQQYCYATLLKLCEKYLKKSNQISLGFTGKKSQLRGPVDHV